MKLKRLTYIGLFALLAASCAKEALGERTLSETGEKTPITVVTNLTASKAATKAVDAEFETNDLLNAYIKHVTVADASANPLVYSADVTGTGVGPRLANFKVSALTDDHKNAADNWTNHSETSTLTVTDAQGLYWDDFSNSVDAAYDLRTSGHALMVYYGYGYNGGSASTALTESSGVLGWTVATDQSSGFKTSDLLYAGQQTPVAYAHGTNNTITGRDKVLLVPYTHAMSKVTVEVICADGFSTTKDNFAGASVKLQNMNTVTTVTAPTSALSAFGTSGEITASGTADASTPNVKKSFSALIAPTVMKENMVLAKIIGVDGNNYDVKLTDAIINAKDGSDAVKADAWSTQLAAYNAETVTPDAAAAYTTANGGLTKPGVHYMITVTIKKQEIKMSATITNWEAVSAEGNGEILFDSDVKDVEDGIADGLKTYGFDVYMSSTTTFGAKATKFSWNEFESKWENSPKIYWEGGATSEYFRALSGVNESLAMAQGKDVLWGTTPKHTGKDVDNHDYTYEKGAAIKPRTGNVPLEFEHAMSKISVTLSSPAGLTEVNLNNAKIDIINIYNKGKINLNTGDMEDLELDLTSSDVYTISGTVTYNNGKYEWLNNVVIPQSLTKDKDGNARNEAPVFYQSGELTKIYNDGTSMPSGGGDGTYYLTNELTPVGAEYYDEAGANAYNATLTGARHEGFEVKYTEEEAAAFNAKLSGAVKAGDPKPSPGDYTAEEALTYNANLPGAVSTSTTKKTYTEADANAYNATLDGARSAGYEEKYTAKEAADYNATLKDAVHEGDPKPSPGNYTADEADDYNSKLYGAVKEGDPKPAPEEGTYSKEEAAAYNATLSGAVKAGDAKPSPGYYTAEEAITHNASLPGAVSTSTTQKTYTEADANTYNATLDGARSVGYEEKYTAKEADEHNAALDGAVKAGDHKPSPGNYTAAEALEYNATLPGAVSTSTTKKTYTAADAAEYNAGLDGAVKPGDLKAEAYYKLPDDKTPATTSLTPHSPGELKTKGDMIMMYITLKNGTRYKLELSKCKDSSSNAIDTWVRGKEYQYTITLGKEEIKFRALIKDWDKTEGSGNATIDWD